MHTTKSNKSWHSFLRTALFSLAVIAVASVLIHFSWNMFAPEVFGAAEMTFKNAFGIVIFIAVLAYIGRPILHKRTLKTNSVEVAK